MVSSSLVDALNHPISAIQEVYDAQRDIDCTFPVSVSTHFAKIFENEEAFKEIPILDVNHPPASHSPNAIVRFRAMVQDTSSSPEMYLAKRGNKFWGWGQTDEEEALETAPNYSSEDLQECAVIWATSIPGENEWYSQEADGPTHTKAETTYLPPQPYKYPLLGTSHIGLQLKVYDNALSDSLKATDALTFVGLLTTESTSISHALDNVNPSLVPTLHVLFSRPLTMPIYPIPNFGAETREELISWIADEAFTGDKDAAEWLLLVIIARVQSRNPPILPPSLTFTHFPLPSSNPTNTSASIDSSSSSPSSPPLPTLSHILSLLLTLSTTIPLSLPLLNDSSFNPESKNEDLHAGYLQLAAGTTVLVSETGVQEGKVTEKGIRNIQALQDVMSSQSLSYIFPYSQFSFPTDIGFIVLAEGRKSAFFQTSITFPLEKSATEPMPDLYKPISAINLPTQDKITCFRALLAASKVGKVAISEAASNHIQDDFVKQRQDDKTVTADDLIIRMTVAKLMALTMHASEVNIDIWEKAKALDLRRRARLV